MYATGTETLTPQHLHVKQMTLATPIIIDCYWRLVIIMEQVQ